MFSSAKCSLVLFPRCKQNALAVFAQCRKYVHYALFVCARFLIKSVPLLLVFLFVFRHVEHAAAPHNGLIHMHVIVTVYACMRNKKQMAEIAYLAVFVRRWVVSPDCLWLPVRAARPFSIQLKQESEESECIKTLNNHMSNNSLLDTYIQVSIWKRIIFKCG